MNPQHEPQIEQYLDRLCAQLTKLPPEKQDEVRRETRAHLEAMIAAKIPDGSSPVAAVTAALRQFGDPVKIGRQIASEWRRDAVQVRETKWAIRLGAVPLLLLIFAQLINFIFAKVRPLFDAANDWLAVFIFVAFCLMCLLFYWRIYQLKRWACIFIVGFGWYCLYDSLTHYLVMSYPYIRHYFDPGIPYYIALTGLTVILTFVLALRRRRLNPGV